MQTQQPRYVMGFDMLPKMQRTKLGKIHSQKNLYKKRSKSEEKYR